MNASSARNLINRDDRGFTITEMLIGIALAGVAAAVVFSVFVSTQGMYYDTRDILNAQSDSRITLGMMAQEIRSAGSDANGAGVERLVICANDTLRIQSDLDSDGIIEGAVEPSEDVTWFYDAGGERLQRNTANGTMTVMEEIAFFGVNYLDSDGTELGPLPLDAAARNRVRAIELVMKVRVEEGAYRWWNSTIALRNDPVLN